MNKIFRFFALFTVVLLAFSACKKENNPTEADPTAGLNLIAQGNAVGSGAKVFIYSAATGLKTGYNPLYIILKDSATGAYLDDAHVHLTPMMDMGMMQHSAPYENPASEEAVGHLFPCSVTFIMPTMSGGSWSLDVEVHNHATDREGAVSFDLTVTDPVKPTIKSFIAAHNGAKYFLALVQPAKPIVGINNLEFALYKKADMMNFPADSSLTIQFTPEMPTMGHGSPNNVNPTHKIAGHYTGKVNFTMTGLWRLNMDLFSGVNVADTTQSFDIEF